VAKTESAVEIQEIVMKEVTVNIIGTSPLILHRFSDKARRELLLGGRKKNVAELQTTLKHDPLAEYRECLYRNRKRDGLTLFHVPKGMVSRTLADVAVDIPGATKAAMDRLTSISTPTLFLFGVPKLFTTMARNSDMAKTPDVRTRPILEHWAVPSITIKYVSGMLTDRKVINLLSAAGSLVGIGDWRPQRKGGEYGAFRVCGDNDPALRKIIAEGGFDAQQAAYNSPEYYDDETEELITWFNEQIAEREQNLPSSDIATVVAAIQNETAGSKKAGNGGAKAKAR
jgi:hypothetical protein